MFTTVEYELTTPPHGPPAFVFCVDTCVSDDELDELKDSLQQVDRALVSRAFRQSAWDALDTCVIPCTPCVPRARANARVYHVGLPQFTNLL